MKTIALSGLNDIIKLNQKIFIYGGIIMQEKQTLGAFIAKKRKEANMTQRDLAEKLYVTESAVSKWERGISYPDISLVSAICDALELNEHELITASEDTNQRKIEKDAKKFNNMKKAYQWTLYISYGSALLACFICNLAINHTLSWFFLVLTSIAVAFSLTSLPSLLKKNKGIITLGAFTGSLILLFMTCCLFTGGDWFWIATIPTLFGLSLIFFPFGLRAMILPKCLSNQKTLIYFIINTVFLFVTILVSMIYAGNFEKDVSIALQITAISLIPAWAMMIVIRYMKINGLYKGSICLFIGTIFSFIVNSFLDVIIDNKPFKLQEVNFSNWSDTYVSGNVNLIVALSLIVISIVLAVGGTISEVTSQNKKA